MFLSDLIQNLRSKPEHARKQIVWLATIGVGLLMIVLWLFLLQSRISQTRQDRNANLALPDELKQMKQELPSIGSSLKSIADTFMDELKKEETAAPPPAAPSGAGGATRLPVE